MQKRGQTEFLLSYLLKLLLVVVILSLGYFAFATVQEKLCRADIAAFQSDVSGADREISDGSVEKRKLGVPCDVDEVYFVDRAKVSSETFSNPFLSDAVVEATSENVFLIKDGEIKDAFYMGELSLPSPGYECLLPTAGGLEFFAEGKGKSVSLVPGCIQRECAQPIESLSDDKAKEILEDFISFNCENCPTSWIEEVEDYRKTLEQVKIFRRYSYCPDTGVTKVEIIIRPAEGADLRNFRMFEYLPKECIDDLEEVLNITAMDGAQIEIRNDPLILWQFDDLEDEITIGYELNKVLDSGCEDLIEGLPISELIVEEGENENNQPPAFDPDFPLTITLPSGSNDPDALGGSLSDYVRDDYTTDEDLTWSIQEEGDDDEVQFMSITAAIDDDVTGEEPRIESRESDFENDEHLEDIRHLLTSHNSGTNTITSGERYYKYTGTLSQDIDLFINSRKQLDVTTKQAWEGGKKVVLKVCDDEEPQECSTKEIIIAVQTAPVIDAFGVLFLDSSGKLDIALFDKIKDDTTAFADLEFSLSRITTGTAIINCAMATDRISCSSTTSSATRNYEEYEFTVTDDDGLSSKTRFRVYRSSGISGYKYLTCEKTIKNVCATAIDALAPCSDSLQSGYTLTQEQRDGCCSEGLLGGCLGILNDLRYNCLMQKTTGCMSSPSCASGDAVVRETACTPKCANGASINSCSGNNYCQADQNGGDNHQVISCGTTKVCNPNAPGGCSCPTDNSCNPSLDTTRAVAGNTNAYEQCETQEGCGLWTMHNCLTGESYSASESDHCACTPNTYTQCSGSDVYNYDSCNNKGSIAIDCTAGQICSGNTCAAITCDNTVTSTVGDTVAYTICAGAKRCKDSNNDGIGTLENDATCCTSSSVPNSGYTYCCTNQCVSNTCTGTSAFTYTPCNTNANGCKVTGTPSPCTAPSPSAWTAVGCSSADNTKKKEQRTVYTATCSTSSGCGSTSSTETRETTLCPLSNGIRQVCTGAGVCKDKLEIVGEPSSIQVGSSYCGGPTPCCRDSIILKNNDASSISITKITAGGGDVSSLYTLPKSITNGSQWTTPDKYYSGSSKLFEFYSGTTKLATTTAYCP